MKFEYIYIDIDDDVSSAVEKILNSAGDNIILFVPDGAEIATSVSSFKLISREAEVAGKKVFINSEEATIIKMAEKAGIEVVEYEEKKTSRRKGPSFIMDIAPPERKAIVKKIEKEESIKENEDLMEKQKKVSKKRTRNRFGLKKILSFVIAIVIIIFVSFYLFAKADITVVSKKYNYSAQSAVLASINLEDIKQSTFEIPAQYFNFDKEVSQKFEATGSSNAGGKSSGIIKIYNNYSSKPQTLVATTRFISKNEGKLFRLIKQTVVPGAKVVNGKITPSYIEAEVEADKIGEEFNIAPDEFSIPGFAGTSRAGKFYGESEKSMMGGYVGDAKVVSAEDLKKAKEKTTEIVHIALEEEMQSKFSDDFKILEDAIIFEIKTVEFSAKENDQRDYFDCLIKGSLKIMSFNEKDIVNLFISDAIGNKAELEEKEFYSQNLKYGVPRLDFVKGQMSFPVDAEIVFRDKIDDKSFINEIAGSTRGGSTSFFQSIEGVSGVKLNITPGFLPILPFRNNNIQIAID